MNYKSTSGTSFGAIDIEVECCRICDTPNGFYLTVAKICEHCDISCTECFGTAIYCTKCPEGYTLNGSNTCTTTFVTKEVANEFFINWTVDSSWTYSAVGGN